MNFATKQDLYIKIKPLTAAGDARRLSCSADLDDHIANARTCFFNYIRKLSAVHGLNILIKLNSG